MSPFDYEPFDTESYTVHMHVAWRNIDPYFLHRDRFFPKKNGYNHIIKIPKFEFVGGGSIDTQLGSCDFLGGEGGEVKGGEGGQSTLNLEVVIS